MYLDLPWVNELTLHELTPQYGRSTQAMVSYWGYIGETWPYHYRATVRVLTTIQVDLGGLLTPMPTVDVASEVSGRPDRPPLGN